MPTERNSEERSDEESLVQRAPEERAARTARRAVNLLLLTMLTLGEAVGAVARIFRVSKVLSGWPRGPVCRVHGPCATEQSEGRFSLPGGEKRPRAAGVGFYFRSTEVI